MFLSERGELVNFFSVHKKSALHKVNEKKVEKISV